MILSALAASVPTLGVLLLAVAIGHLRARSPQPGPQDPKPGPGYPGPWPTRTTRAAGPSARRR